MLLLLIGKTLPELAHDPLRVFVVGCDGQRLVHGGDGIGDLPLALEPCRQCEIVGYDRLDAPLLVRRLCGPRVLGERAEPGAVTSTTDRVLLGPNPSDFNL